MSLPKIPAKFCNQAITLALPAGEMDRYGKRQTVTLKIDRVLVQPQTIYSGDSNSRKIVANAIVFLFAGVSTPLPQLDKSAIGSKVTFEGKDYTVTNIVDNREPFGNAVYSYELEVL